jgi:hypothetical protein
VAIGKDYGSAESHRSAEITHWVTPSGLRFLQISDRSPEKLRLFQILLEMPLGREKKQSRSTGRQVQWLPTAEGMRMFPVSFSWWKRRWEDERVEGKCRKKLQKPHK